MQDVDLYESIFSVSIFKSSFVHKNRRLTSCVSSHLQVLLLTFLFAYVSKPTDVPDFHVYVL